MKKYLDRTCLFLIMIVFGKYVYAQGVDNFISNQIQSQISRQISAEISHNLNENLLIPQLQVRENAGEILDFSLSNDNRYFNVLHRDGSVRIWDAEQGVQRPIISPGGLHFTKVISSSSEGMVLIGGNNGSVYIYDILTGKLKTELNSENNNEISALTISNTETKLAAVHADGQIHIWDLKGQTKIAELKPDYGNKINRMIFLSNGEKLLINFQNGNVETWDFSNSKSVAKLNMQSLNNIGAWEDPPNELVFIDNNASLQSMDIQGNRILSTKKILADVPLLSSAINFANNLLAISTNSNNIRLFNLNDLSSNKEISTNAVMANLQIINKGRHLIGSDNTGVLHIWDIAQANEVLRLISTRNGWTVIDNVGRFDSSEKGLANVSWQAGGKDIPLDNFSGNYYEPDLLATQLNSGAFINKAPQKIEAGINLPPNVSMSVPGKIDADNVVKVVLDISDAGGGIGEHRFYQNGKILGEIAVEESNDTEVDGVKHKIISYRITLLPGSNEFKVIATNKMGIESLAQRQLVQNIGESQQPDLYIVVVGINKYLDANLDLSYSVNDAKSMAATLGNRSASVFKNIYPIDLLDENATREAIIAKMNDIAARAKAKDVLIVYFAGHGIAVNGEWYFLPHETSFHPDEQYYAGVGLAAAKIQSLIAKIPAERILVMFDSCYSGSGVTVFENLRKTQRHFSRSLSKSDGIVVLAATRKDQEALESAELGHGLFTYIVNNGMRGAADLSPMDKKISAHEVADYAAETIPNFTHKYANAAQEPTSFTLGTDFFLLGL